MTRTLALVGATVAVVLTGGSVARDLTSHRAPATQCPYGYATDVDGTCITPDSGAMPTEMEWLA